tara:strand:+ start:280 stop:429 length:150 start_codon:yes stop_codon:yes gene_type:complete
MVIDGIKGIETDSAEWHFFFWKKRYFDFLLDLVELLLNIKNILSYIKVL